MTDGRPGARSLDGTHDMDAFIAGVVDALARFGVEDGEPVVVLAAPPDRRTVLLCVRSSAGGELTADGALRLHGPDAVRLARRVRPLVDLTARSCALLADWPGDAERSRDARDDIAAELADERTDLSDAWAFPLTKGHEDLQGLAVTIDADHMTGYHGGAARPVATAWDRRCEVLVQILKTFGGELRREEDDDGDRFVYEATGDDARQLRKSMIFPGHRFRATPEAPTVSENM